MTRFPRRAFLGAAAALAAPPFARAQARGVEISVQYSIPVLFRELFERIGAEFMRANPDIRIAFRAPEEGYEEILQRNLRDSITRTLPDVAFHGLNRQRTLAERNIPVDLKPIMAADPETKSLGYSESLLSLGQVGGAQTGIGFSLSTPILYYNVDLMRRAGGDPAKPPGSWQEVNALARAIHGSAEGVQGMFFDWTITGNWSWQGLVFSHGGAMTSADETRIAFGEEPGRRAIRALRGFVEEGRMPDIRPATMFSDFFAGRMGISMQSTAQLGRYNREIGGRFPLLTGRYPLSAPEARLPPAAMSPCCSRATPRSRKRRGSSSSSPPARSARR